MRALALPVFAGALMLVVGCHQEQTYASDACINNLRLIESAKEQWVKEHPNTTNHVLTWDDVRGYIGRGPSGVLPTCPADGSYTLGRVGEKPTCSIARHKLP